MMPIETRVELLPEIERLIRALEVIIINFGLSEGPKLDDSKVRLDMIRLLEVLCESKQFIIDILDNLDCEKRSK